MVKDLCIKAATVLPDDVVEALKTSRLQESEPVAVDVLDMILENAQIAVLKGFPSARTQGDPPEVGRRPSCGDLYQAVSMGVARDILKDTCENQWCEIPFARAIPGTMLSRYPRRLGTRRSDVKITVMPKGLAAKT